MEMLEAALDKQGCGLSGGKANVLCLMMLCTKRVRTAIIATPAAPHSGHQRAFRFPCPRR